MDEFTTMKPHRIGVRAMAEAFAAVVIWGATFVATKIALKEASPAMIVWLRFGMGLLILGAAARVRGQLSPPQRSDFPYLALLGLLSVALHQWLQANGLVTAQATTTAWIVASTPIFIALLGALVLRERLRLPQGLGIALAALGVLLVVSKGDPRALWEGTSASMGDILVLISALNWAVCTVISRPGLARIPASRMTFYVMLAGWLFVTVWFIASGPETGDFARLSTRGWLAILALGIFGSGFAYIMYYDALRVLPASQLGVFLNIEPLVTMLLAAPMLGEPITITVLLGGGLILAGIYLVNHRYESPEVIPLDERSA